MAIAPSVTASRALVSRRLPQEDGQLRCGVPEQAVREGGREKAEPGPAARAGLSRRRCAEGAVLLADGSPETRVA